MPARDAIRAEGLIIEARSDRLYRVELANGHQFFGFVPARGRAAGVRYAPGQRVRVELSPCDLSKGRILMDDE
jgi:translation initiation factor IF-1